MVHCTGKRNPKLTRLENKACHTLQYHDPKINVLFTCSKCTMTWKDNYRVVSKTPYSSTPCVILFYKPYLSMCCHQVLLQSQTAYWHSWRRLVSWQPPSWVPLPSSGLRKSRSIRRCWVVTDRHIHQRHTPVHKHNEPLDLKWWPCTQYIVNTILVLHNLKLFLSVLTFSWMTQSGGEPECVDLAKQKLLFALSYHDSQIDLVTKGLLQTHAHARRLPLNFATRQIGLYLHFII